MKKKKLLSFLIGLMSSLSITDAKDEFTKRNSVIHRGACLRCKQRTKRINNQNRTNYGGRILRRNNYKNHNLKNKNLKYDYENNKQNFQNIVDYSRLHGTKKFIYDNKNIMIGTSLPLAAVLTGVGINEFLSSYPGIYFTSSNDGGFKPQQKGVQNKGIECRKRFITGNKYIFKIVYGQDKQTRNSEILACRVLKNCKDKRVKPPKNYRVNADGNYVFIYEFADGMPLKDYAKTLKTNKEKYMALFKIVKQLLEIHIKLHALGVEHGDMHTGNFFVKMDKNEPIVQLFDFGKCKEVEQQGSITLPDQFFDIVRDIEHALFECGAYVDLHGNPIGYGGNILKIGATGKNYSMFELLKKIFNNDQWATDEFFESNCVPFRNYFFGKLLSKNALEINPSFSYNGITDDEVKYICKGKELNYENIDIGNLISFLDRKINRFDGMSENEIDKICPTVKIDINNVDYYIGQKK